MCQYLSCSTSKTTRWNRYKREKQCCVWTVAWSLNISFSVFSSANFVTAKPDPVTTVCVQVTYRTQSYKRIYINYSLTNDLLNGNPKAIFVASFTLLKHFKTNMSKQSIPQPESGFSGLWRVIVHLCWTNWLFVIAADISQNTASYIVMSYSILDEHSCRNLTWL